MTSCSDSVVNDQGSTSFGNVLNLDGDCVEFGVPRGFMSGWVIDLPREVHGSVGGYEAVGQRFEPFDNVKVIQGVVPRSLHGGAPKHICYLHLDLNSAKAEGGALHYLWERIVPGAYIVFDDYGWSAFPNQQRQHDRFMADGELSNLELPTGRGLVIKR